MLSSGKWEGWGSTWRVLVNLQRTWVSVEPPLQDPKVAVSSAPSPAQRSTSTGSRQVLGWCPCHQMPASVLRTFDLIRFTQQVESIFFSLPLVLSSNHYPTFPRPGIRSVIIKPHSLCVHNPSQEKKKQKQKAKSRPKRAELQKQRKKRKEEPNPVLYGARSTSPPATPFSQAIPPRRCYIIPSHPARLALGFSMFHVSNSAPL
ncbi:hypothetical protein HDV62DRAFT_46487 [Trichoderma sp. SZMC 28011]